MRGVLVGLALVPAAVGIGALCDATQDRPDVVRPGTTATVVFDVGTRRHHRTEAEAASALWGVCVATLDNTVVAGPAPEDGGYAVTVEPELGEHARRRLVGCLEDVTLDRTSGHVISITTGTSAGR